MTLTAGDPGNVIGSIIGRLGSGLPYTPSLQNQRTGLENSDNRPTYYNVDLYVTKYFKMGSLGFSLFLKVYNLFDTASRNSGGKSPTSITWLGDITVSQ